VKRLGGLCPSPEFFLTFAKWCVLVANIMAHCCKVHLSAVEGPKTHCVRNDNLLQGGRRKTASLHTMSCIVHSCSVQTYSGMAFIQFCGRMANLDPSSAPPTVLGCRESVMTGAPARHPICNLRRCPTVPARCQRRITFPAR